MLLASGSGTQAAQRAAPAADPNYPTRPIRLIVPQAAGGSNDIMARSVGHYLSGRFGKQVVVDNRAGADAMIGTEMGDDGQKIEPPSLS